MSDFITPALLYEKRPDGHIRPREIMTSIVLVFKMEAEGHSFNSNKSQDITSWPFNIHDLISDLCVLTNTEKKDYRTLEHNDEPIINSGNKQEFKRVFGAKMYRVATMPKDECMAFLACQLAENFGGRKAVFEAFVKELHAIEYIYDNEVDVLLSLLPHLPDAFPSETAVEPFDKTKEYSRTMKTCATNVLGLQPFVDEVATEATDEAKADLMAELLALDPNIVFKIAYGGYGNPIDKMNALNKWKTLFTAANVEHFLRELPDVVSADPGVAPFDGTIENIRPLKRPAKNLLGLKVFVDVVCTEASPELKTEIMKDFLGIKNSANYTAKQHTAYKSTYGGEGTLENKMKAYKKLRPFFLRAKIDDLLPKR